MNQIERTLILGALFHDIGKFEQRCTGNPNKKYHQILGVELIQSGRFIDKFIKIVGEDNLNSLLNIISEHHNQNAKDLTEIVRIADHLSASERVDKEETEFYKDLWNHKHLASLFSKINILNDKSISHRYYKHKQLTKIEHDVIIPTGKNEEEIKEFSYKESDWNLFLEDLEYVLDIYENENDFDSLINLLLIIFEKYMWCIPDFTGSSETDISLFNHLKDVTGIAHAIYLSQLENKENKNLNLIIGDIPGIQNYIFDIVNRKPAKILRGRSIFIQILTRNLATKFLKEFGLTENNLIMLAGGKFYIVAPSNSEFENKFHKLLVEINKYLFENFRLEISFNSAFHTFNFIDLMNKSHPVTFGQIVEEASHKLIENKHLLFNERFFENNNIKYDNYIWEEKYIDDDGTGSDSVKCKVTDKPIRKNRKKEIKIPTDNGLENLIVDQQVAVEYNIGEKIVGNNIIVILDENNLSIDSNNIKKIKDFNSDKSYKNTAKLLLNPTFETLKNSNVGKEIFINTHYIEVANYCSKNNDDVMPFNEISEENDGAKFLSLIKGDIDNLGLIMAYGLSGTKEDLTAISRTTTLSNHLKYFFSFFLNGFLNEWELKNKENKVYTIFAGGDDLMFVTPQSSAIELINTLNKKFSEFSCDNNEVHISYSITHFKHDTPIRLVADFSEENQKNGKNYTRASQNKLFNKKDSEAFNSINDKAGTFLFDTYINNNELGYLLNKIKFLTSMGNDEKSGLSKGLIRKLLELSETIKKYEESKDATYLISYARMNHTVNRILKNKNNEILSFFNDILLINKDGNEEAQKLGKILHPLVCQLIYNLRNN